MDKCMWLQYPSSIEQIVEQNESFDACTIRICYTGKNRNGSSISKDAIENAIPSIYNCPIVCNYNVQDDTIGGHDVEIVKTDKGYRLINLTDAVGVIPANCHHYWETVSENGKDHEYLCIEAILWKRSSAYEKIKNDGIVSQSMEITVKSGKTVDGFYEIDSFIFTAFCLLGDDVEPCFESASLEMFSLQRYKQQFSDMMSDFDKHFLTVNSSNGEDIYSRNSKQNLSKGGKISLDRMELLTEYGLTAESLDFNIEDFTIEELREKFEKMKKPVVEDDDDDDTVSEEPDGDNGEEGGEGEGDENDSEDTTGSEEEGTNDDGDGAEGTDTAETYSLTGEQFVSEVIEALSVVKYTDPNWGEMRRYYYIDYDPSCSEVYFYDAEDWKMYGCTYSTNGDRVVIDFESKKRKKFSIVDFDEGSADFNCKYAFDAFGQAIASNKDAVSEQKYSEATQTISALQSEIDALNTYKKSKMDEERTAALNELFAQFADLNGVEAFEALRNSCDGMELDAIESKCYEIKGRSISGAKFSAQQSKPTRIVVEKNNSETQDNEPYGGLFLKFPPKNI